MYDEINENDMQNECDMLKYKYQKENGSYMEPIDNAPYMRITNPWKIILKRNVWSTYSCLICGLSVDMFRMITNELFKIDTEFKIMDALC